MLDFRWKHRERIRALETQVAQLQHSVSLTWDSAATARNSSDGNPYPDYQSQVLELARKFDGTSEWGNQQIQSAIAFLSANIIGGGVDFIPADEFDDKTAKRELEFIEKFQVANDLDGETTSELVSQGQIEGKTLIRLQPDIPNSTIKARWVSWIQHGYTIETNPDDYQEYTLAKYNLNRTGVSVVLSPKQFIFCQFGGRSTDPNNSYPRFGAVLRYFEDIDRAMWDWRKMNRYFASPTPHFKVSDSTEGRILEEYLQAKKWKIGQFVVTTAEYALVGMPSGGMESILSEIESKVKTISGHTGVPVQVLGFADLLNGRTTADSLYDAVMAAVSSYRNLWTSAFTELAQKALAMANNQLQGGFNVNAVKAVLPEIQSAQFSQLMEKWVPLAEKKLVSRQTVIERIPDIDPETELARIEEETQRAIEVTRMENAASNPQDDAPEMPQGKSGKNVTDIDEQKMVSRRAAK